MGRPSIAIVAAVAAAATACAFHRTGSGPPSPDAAQPITCGQLTCDPHATCTMTDTGASCACATGYSGDGATCMAIDPCATNNGGCSAACAMTGPGMATCYTPQTCADVAAHVTVANDSTVTLYATGDPAKPWTALCHGGVEYLTLPAGAANNFGQYTASTKSPGTSVRTTYASVRVDPTTFLVDICDQTFATSTGMLMHDPAHNGNDPVTSMPLGSAMDCAGGNPVTGVANIDLTGAPFVVTSGWSKAGNSSGNGTLTKTGGGRVVAITGGGDCGWNAPSNAPVNPFNTFTGSKLVQLGYLQ